MQALAREGRTVFVSSHLMSEMAVTADHLIVIGRGQLIASSSMQEFIQRSSERSVLVRTPDAARLSELIVAAGGEVHPAGDRRRRGLTAIRTGRLMRPPAWSSPACPPRGSASSPPPHRSCCTSSRPRLASLEEAFMELTADSVEYGDRSTAAAGNRPAAAESRPAAERSAS